MNNKPGCFHCRLFHFYCLCRAGVQCHNSLRRGKPALLASKAALHRHEVASPQHPTSGTAQSTWIALPTTVVSAATFAQPAKQCFTHPSNLWGTLQSPSALPGLFIWKEAVFLGTTFHGIGSDCAATSVGQILNSCSVSVLGLFRRLTAVYLNK